MSVVWVVAWSSWIQVRWYELMVIHYWCLLLLTICSFSSFFFFFPKKICTIQVVSFVNPWAYNHIFPKFYLCHWSFCSINVRFLVFWLYYLFVSLVGSVCLKPSVENLQKVGCFPCILMNVNSYIICIFLRSVRWLCTHIFIHNHWSSSFLVVRLLML